MKLIPAKGTTEQKCKATLLNMYILGMCTALELENNLMLFLKYTRRQAEDETEISLHDKTIASMSPQDKREKLARTFNLFKDKKTYEKLCYFLKLEITNFNVTSATGQKILIIAYQYKKRNNQTDKMLKAFLANKRINQYLI